MDNETKSRIISELKKILSSATNLIKIIGGL